MRGISIACLLALGCLCAAFASSTALADSSTPEILTEAVKDIDSGQEVAAKEKLASVLEKESDNYHALVLLSQLEMKQLSGPDQPKRALKIEQMLLRAAIGQPHRPEAYLVLASFFYRAGDINRGDVYAERAEAVEPEPYEAVCLLGQRYEDAGNFVGAMDVYNRGLDFPSYRDDAYLLDKRYMAAAQGGLEPWEKFDFRVGNVRMVWLYPRFPDFFHLWLYRKDASPLAHLRAPYELPDTKFRYCESEKPLKSRFNDLYEAFIKASVTDEAEYTALRAKLETLRQEALKEVGGINDPAAKAKALYMWLKRRVLKQYDIEKGALAQEVLNNNIYLCLNGSILYTLFANDAGIPVKGVVTPGHAFASLDMGARKIEIELTAEPMFGTSREDGFDVDWWTQFRQLNLVNAYGGVRGISPRLNIGEVDPGVLTAHQFTNAFVYGRDQITEKHKADQEYLGTLAQLQRQLGASDRERRRDITKQTEEINYKIQKDVADYYEKTGLNLLRQARALAPGAERFPTIQEEMYLFMAGVDIRPAVMRIKDWRERVEEQLERRETFKARQTEEQQESGKDSPWAGQGTGEIEDANAKLKQLEEEHKEKWAEEKTTWLKGLSRLEEALNELPCSIKIKRSLEKACFLIVMLAEASGDQEAVANVIGIGLSRLPESDFAKFYRYQRFGS